MEIDLPGLTSALLQRSGSQTGATPVATPASGTALQPTAGDSVSLTPDAQSLRNLERAMGSLPVVDQDAVNRVREAISTGNYRIDPVQVAEKMTQFESRLFA